MREIQINRVSVMDFSLMWSDLGSVVTWCVLRRVHERLCPSVFSGSCCCLQLAVEDICSDFTQKWSTRHQISVSWSLRLDPVFMSWSHTWDGRVAVVMRRVFLLGCARSTLHNNCNYVLFLICVCVSMRDSFSWSILGLFYLLVYENEKPKNLSCLTMRCVSRYNPHCRCSWSYVHIPEVLQQRMLCEEVGFSSGWRSFSEGKKLWAFRGETLNVKTMTTLHRSGGLRLVVCHTDDILQFCFILAMNEGMLE